MVTFFFFLFLASLLAFNSIFPIISKETSLVNQFIFEILYFLIKNLSIPVYNKDLLEQIKKGLQSVIISIQDNASLLEQVFFHSE